MTGALPVRLLQLTDPHLFEDESRELYGVNTATSFRAALARGLGAAPGPLDAVLVTGDIAEDGHWKTYERFRSIMSQAGVRVICTPGNHENPPMMSALFSAPPLQYCGSTSVRDWRIVLLDSHVPGEDWGWLNGHELDRLDRELAVATGQHALVCLHHQPLPVGSPWLDSVGLRNADALHSILRRHRNVRGVLSGHVHQAFDRTQHGIRFMSTPSTCAQFTPGTRNCVMDLRPPGFRWLELMPTGEIETEVAWLDELRRTERPLDSRREVAV
jgi:3',5'-cyclic-AMP phosphodiesterase